MNNKIENEPLFINSSSAIIDALSQMDLLKRKMLIVMDGVKFVSILSIGDIQRAILNKISLNESIVKILRKTITVCHEDDEPESIKKLMLKFRTECMPILGSQGNLVDVLFWEDIFGLNSKRNNVSLDLPVVIMAGGKGTRLKPLTNILPKPLLPFNQKTIIEEIMDRFVAVGCSEFYLSLNYKADLIKFYLNTLKEGLSSINYFEEDKPLGSAGSLYLLKDKIHKTFFVSNCDILIDQDLEEIYQYHKENKNEITIVSALKRYKIQYGTIETRKNGVLNKLDEKPELVFQINTGMYILEPGVLSNIPHNKFFHITDLIEIITNNSGKIGVFPISENSWQDIGNWEDYSTLLRKV